MGDDYVLEINPDRPKLNLTYFQPVKFEEKHEVESILSKELQAALEGFSQLIDTELLSAIPKSIEEDIDPKSNRLQQLEDIEEYDGFQDYDQFYSDDEEKKTENEITIPERKKQKTKSNFT